MGDNHRQSMLLTSS